MHIITIRIKEPTIVLLFVQTLNIIDLLRIRLKIDPEYAVNIDPNVSNVILNIQLLLAGVYYFEYMR